jgi:4-hydroxythreonine-4-phosphate dehydrogenase
MGTTARDGAFHAASSLALPPLALTMGDPAGIGPEIALKAWLHRSELQLPPFCYYGNAASLQDRAKSFGYTAPVAIIAHPSDAVEAFARAVPVIDLPISAPVAIGRPSSRNGAAVIAAIERAVADVHAGTARAIVTNPIAKSVLYEAGFAYPGHTEFLAALSEKHWPGKAHIPVMMLSCAALKVVPLTIHVPLAQVPSLITPTLILTSARIVAEALKSDFGILAPRIAIAGLNPHAGEAGTIGLEDVDIIAPALEALRADGISVSGPHSADTLFHEAARKTYDAVIAMYHDQALIPIKTLAFDEGVNVTLGLPFVRTSPDHGTAFDIAAQGIASPRSLIEALKLADVMSRRRAMATA